MTGEVLTADDALERLRRDEAEKVAKEVRKTELKATIERKKLRN